MAHDTGDLDAQPKVDVEQELRRMNEEWVRALVERDTSTLNRLMADDFVFIFTLEGDSKQQFIADIESGDLAVESLSRDNVDVRTFDNTAVISSLDRAKWRYRGHEILSYYRILHVYAKRGQWQLVTVQACPIDP